MDKDVEAEPLNDSSACLTGTKVVSELDAEIILATVLEEYFLPIIGDIRARYGSGSVADQALNVIYSALVPFFNDRGKAVFSSQWKQALKTVETTKYSIN